MLTHSWVLGSWFDSTKCPLTQSGLFTIAIALLLACDDQLFFYSIATLLSVCMHTVNSTLQSRTLRTYVHTRYLCTLTLVCVCACCACVCVCGVYVCMCVCVHDLVFLSHCRPHTRYLCTLTLVYVCACCACVCVCGVYVCMCVCVHDLVFLSHCRPHLVASPRVPV